MGLHIRNQCRKITVLSCHRCLIKTGVEKNERHQNMDYNFDHQMSPSRGQNLDVYHISVVLDKNFALKNPTIPVTSSFFNFTSPVHGLATSQIGHGFIPQRCIKESRVDI